MKLPSPSLRGTRTLEEVLARRRSTRSFLDRPIEWAAIAQILWAGQGVSEGTGGRTTPSAGSRYPLDLYTVTEGGLGRYHPDEHALDGLQPLDLREALYRAAYYVDALRQAPLVIGLCASLERAEQGYGEARAHRFALLEAGHAAQNILLQAYAMGLAGVAFGAFDDQKVAETLKLPAGCDPLYLIAIGYAGG